MTLLALSLIALALGPVVLRFARGSDVALRVLDGFIYIAIGGLVLFHVLPPLVERVGLWAFVAAGVGMLGPTIIERRIQASARSAHTLALLFACLALAIHGFLDGIALVGGTEHADLSNMGLAVVLHRLPVGLTVWWLVAPSWGKRAAAGSLAGIAVATLAGWAVGAQAIQTLDLPVMSLCYALVGGSLLHVLLHRSGWGNRQATGRLARYGAGFGGVTGGLFLFALQASEQPGHGHDGLAHSATGFGDLLLQLSLESAPALLLAYVAAGVIQAWLPKSSVEWMGRGGPLSQSARGVAFGLPLPICSCGVIPVYRSLIVQGAPPAAAMAFLVATPELGLDAVLLSIPLLGGEMTVARVVCAALVALLVGAVVGGKAKVEPSVSSVEGGTLFERPPGFGPRLRLAVHSGLVEVVDHTAPWILVGLVAAAAVQPSLQSSWLQSLPDTAEVLVFALLGLPVYVCASGATPLVAVLLAANISAGAGVAFLLAGPATNITTFGVLASLHGRRTALAFGGLIVLVCVALGLLINVLFPGMADGVIALGGEHGASALQWTALGGLVLLCVGSLVRQGPRGFFGQVISQSEGDCDDQCHDDGHEHSDDDAGSGQHGSHDHGGHDHDDDCCH
jgi:uncharacterized membrane protein YraQ (UPF0718 family)